MRDSANSLRVQEGSQCWKEDRLGSHNWGCSLQWGSGRGRLDWNS